MTNVKESTLTKSIAVFVGLTAGLFMLGFASLAPANAQTNAELQAQIQSLLETISNLQAQVDGGASAGSDGYSNCNLITQRDLSLGSQGPEVRDLQVFLNQSSETRLAASGPGSPGQETTYFGPLTEAAVNDFQARYSAEILAPLNLSAPTGYWGASSRAQARVLCEAPAEQPDDGDDEDEDGDDEDDEELSGGEASLENYSYRSGDDSNVNEGDDGDIAEIEFDVEDGDARLSRVDLSMVMTDDNSGAGDTDPWDNFDEIALVADGDEIASMDASDEDNYLDDNGFTVDGNNSPGGNFTNNTGYVLRFSGLEEVYREGDEVNLSVRVTAQNGVDGADNITWGTWIQNQGVRMVDSEGIQQYAGDDADGETFDIDSEGQGENLSFSIASDNPDSSIVQVDTNTNSDDYGVFVFEVDSDEGDVDIEDLPITFSTISTSTNGTTTFSNVVDDAYLEVDGQEYDDWTETENGSADQSVGGTNRTVSTSTLDFTFDDEITVEEDEDATFTLFVSFNQQSGNYNEGTSVQGEMTTADVNNVNAEGADNLSGTQLDGSAQGDIHDLRTSGVFIEENDTSATFRENDNATTTDNEGDFTVEFDLTAFEGDFFVPKGATRSTSSTNSPDQGARYSIEDNGGNATTTGSASASLSSTADTASGNSNVWRVDDGETETFTLSVNYNPSNSDFYNVQLLGARYADSANNATDGDLTEASGEIDTEVTATPAQDFETNQINI